MREHLPGLPEIRLPELPEYVGLREILVAVDGSPFADNALQWAIAIAKEHDAHITVMHVVSAAALTSLSLELQHRIGDDLAVLERKVRDAGVQAASRWDTGKPWEAITQAADEIGANVIVVGARGHTAFSALRLGSTADRVVRMAQVPVLLIPPKIDGRPRPLRRIIAATDFSDCSHHAIVAALRVLPGHAEDAELVLLHAWQPLVEYSFGEAEVVTVDPLDETDEQILNALETLAKPLRERGYIVRVEARQGYPAGVIEREAMTFNADLIVMGTHGRTGAMRLLLGSVAERVLHLAPCPVLTVRASGSSSAE
jgi:nucleotide-binding universal stress UspA family protein